MSTIMTCSANGWTRTMTTCFSGPDDHRSTYRGTVKSNYVVAYVVKRDSFIVGYIVNSDIIFS